MPDRVVSTKLFAPLRRPNQVARPRLVAHLAAGLNQGRPLTLISAPAGFGKTTLAVDWIHALDGRWRAAWLSRDEGDNNLPQFCRCLIAALQRAVPGLGQSVLALLGAVSLPPVPELLGPLLNQLPATSQSILLVLEDYHLIVNDDVHEARRFVLAHQPANLHLSLLSREDPPLPLPRLRVRGQLTEVRERDLRFSADEVHTFLNQTLGLVLSADLAATLTARTEGWVATLQLAALALQETAGPEKAQAFVAGFAHPARA